MTPASRTAHIYLEGRGRGSRAPIAGDRAVIYAPIITPLQWKELARHGRICAGRGRRWIPDVENAGRGGSWCIRNGIYEDSVIIVRNKSRAGQVAVTPVPMLVKPGIICVCGTPNLVMGVGDGCAPVVGDASKPEREGAVLSRGRLWVYAADG